MLRFPKKVVFEITVYSAVIAWEVYKHLPFRPKAEQGPVQGVQEVEVDNSHYAPTHRFSWCFFPPELEEQEAFIVIHARMPEFCPGCMNLDNYVKAGVTASLSKCQDDVAAYGDE